MARLKIATFNINGIRARSGALLEWLEREAPDVACLQELKAPDEAFPLSDIEALGYGAVWHGQKSWNGVAILARGAQPELRRRGLPDDPDPTQSRYLEVDVHGLRVAGLYLPNGNPWPGPKFDYKLEWFDALRRHASKLLADGVPTVVCGDFNVVPTDELDIYNPASWRKDALLQPESREAWFGLLGQGWTDALRTVHGDEKIFTFWDYFRRHWDRDAGLRIDHLLLSPSLAPLLADAGVDRWVRGRPGASDHAPTWVLLDAARTAGRRAASTTRSPARASTSSEQRRTGKAAAKTVTRRATRRDPAAALPRATNAAKKSTARKAAATKVVTKGAKKVAKKVAPAKRAAKTTSAKVPAARRGAPPAGRAAVAKRTGSGTASSPRGTRGTPLLGKR